jgi:quercetin dioxygenase-like cupin family protein
MKLTILIGTAAVTALIASSAALATPPSGLSVSNVVDGHFGEIQENTTGNKTGNWGMILKTLDDTDVGADLITLQPQGTTGWHSHPAPVFVTVTQGSIVWSDSLLCAGRVLNVGDSVVEHTARAHVAVNPAAPGGQVAQFIAVRIKPTSVVGFAFVIDEPVPNNCQ